LNLSYITFTHVAESFDFEEWFCSRQHKLQSVRAGVDGGENLFERFGAQNYLVDGILGGELKNGQFVQLHRPDGALGQHSLLLEPEREIH